MRAWTGYGSTVVTVLLNVTKEVLRLECVGEDLVLGDVTGGVTGLFT